jgi:hypothetical protein
VCQATGWTWDDVEDRLTVTRLRALVRHWRAAPPPPLLLGLIAQALGVHPQQHRGSWGDLTELAADPRSGLAVRGKPPV